MGFIPAYHNFMQWGNQNDEEVGLPAVWKVNGEINIPYLDSLNGRVSSVYSIPKYENKVLVLIGMGQSLDESIPALKGLPDRFIKLATNSSCEYLLKHGIQPDYVVLLDGKPGNWTLDLGEQAKDITAIFGPCAEPEAIKAWPGNIMIVPLGVKNASLNRRIRKRWGKAIPAGGNALNSGFSIFGLLTDVKIVVFVGNDLSFKETYYGDGRPSNNDESVYFFAKDIHGDEVRTLIPLFEYKIWLETVMAQTYPEYVYINCSNGILGIDTDGEILGFCSHMTLEKAVQEIEDAYVVQDKDVNYKLKYLYDQFYDHDLGNIQRGKGIWQIALNQFEITRGLDIGCGRANGVQYAREQGYDVSGCDISSAAVKCWKERGVAEYCEVCPADKMPYPDNSFDFIICSEVMEHIPEADTDKTLKEILRVGSDKYLFTIAMVPESIPVGGIVQSHINLHDTDWWLDKVTEMGFHVANHAVNKDYEDLTILAVKDKQKYLDGADLFRKGVKITGIPVLGCPDNPVPGVEEVQL